MTHTAITIEEIKNSDIVADMEANGLTVAMFIGKFHHPEHAENDWAIELYEINGTKVVATNGGTIWDNGNPDFDQMIAEYGITLNANKETEMYTIVVISDNKICWDYVDGKNILNEYELEEARAAAREGALIVDIDDANYVHNARWDASNYDWGDCNCTLREGDCCGECDECFELMTTQDIIYLSSRAID